MPREIASDLVKLALLCVGAIIVRPLLRQLTATPSCTVRVVKPSSQIRDD
jgi:hypothetical protein